MTGQLTSSTGQTRVEASSRLLEGMALFGLCLSGVHLTSLVTLSSIPLAPSCSGASGAIRHPALSDLEWMAPFVCCFTRAISPDHMAWHWTISTGASTGSTQRGLALSALSTVRQSRNPMSLIVHYKVIFLLFPQTARIVNLWYGKAYSIPLRWLSPANSSIGVICTKETSRRHTKCRATCIVSCSKTRTI